jgi:hypothetical protein
MKQTYDNSTGHIIAEVDGKLMLLDTGAARTFYDEYQGVRINILSHMLERPIDGVLGMDSIKGKVVSISRDLVDFNAVAPDKQGATLNYTSGIPFVDIMINKVPCRAAIRTGATASYISEELISKDKYTKSVNDRHPVYGHFSVKMFVNYFSIADKNYFADAGEMPAEFTSLSSSGVDAIIGADILDRFELVLDFSADSLHLISN